MPGQRQKPASRLQGHRSPTTLTVVEATPSATSASSPPIPLAFDGRPLLPAAQQRWGEFWASPLAEVVDMRADGERLTRWAQAVNERLIVTPLVTETRLVRGSTGQLRLNPLVSYVAELTAEVERAEQHFGMTPLARFRLGIEAGEAALTADALNRRLDELSLGRG